VLVLQVTNAGVRRPGYEADFFVEYRKYGKSHLQPPYTGHNPQLWL